MFSTARMSGFKSLPKIPRYPIAPPETPVVETGKKKESRFGTEGIVRVEGQKPGPGGSERFRREKEHVKKTNAFKTKQYEYRFAKLQERIRKEEEEKRVDEFKVELQAKLDAHAELAAAEDRAKPQHRQNLDKLKPRADTCWPPAGL